MLIRYHFRKRRARAPGSDREAVGYPRVQCSAFRTLQYRGIDAVILVLRKGSGEYCYNLPPRTIDEFVTRRGKCKDILLALS